MIIGLSGYARSGKDTVAGMLDGYRRIAFADKMREVLYRLDPLLATGVRLRAEVNFWGWDHAKTMPEVRRLLQFLGTEVGREMFGENFWVDLALKDVQFNDYIVVTDVRFPNEAQAIIDRGGEIWRIERQGFDPVNVHSSEVAMDDWKFDRVIKNDGTLEDLRKKVLA